jgi:hypothetical protein
VQPIIDLATELKRKGEELTGPDRRNPGQVIFLPPSFLLSLLSARIRVISGPSFHNSPDSWLVVLVAAAVARSLDFSGGLAAAADRAPRGPAYSFISCGAPTKIAAGHAILQCANSPECR